MRTKFFKTVGILLMLLMSISTVSYANSKEIAGEYTGENGKGVYEQTLSEYDYFKAVKIQEKSKLLAQGMSEEEIDYIKNFDLQGFAEEMRNSSDEELKQRGLSAEEIKEVRTARNDATVLAVTMGKVTYRIAKVSYTYDSAKKITSLRTNATWEWASKPVSCYTDIVGVGTSENFKVDSGKATISYYMNGDLSTSPKTVAVTHSPEKSGLNASCSFAMKKTLAQGTTRRVHYAMKGSLQTNWSVSGNIRTVGIASNYGHAVLSCTPSLSVSAGGVGISFSPASKIDFGKEAYSSITR